MAWESGELRAAVEALLFASDTPVSTETLCDVLPGASAGSVRASIEELTETYSSEHGGLQIVNVAGGYHIRTRPEVSHWVERLLRKRRKMRLSQAALETLAIVAYKQPVTKIEMESIRGVDIGGVLGTLLERDLIAIKGRSKGPGRPLLYGTTREFLDHFGLNNLTDLPSLEELESLLAKRDADVEGVGLSMVDEAVAAGHPAQEEVGEGDELSSADEVAAGEHPAQEEASALDQASDVASDSVVRSPSQGVDG